MNIFEVVVLLILNRRGRHIAIDVLNMILLRSTGPTSGSGVWCISNATSDIKLSRILNITRETPMETSNDVIGVCLRAECVLSGARGVRVRSIALAAKPLRE